MNGEQDKALLLALGLHNIIITGRAGTGKTFTAIQIATNIKREQKNFLEHVRRELPVHVTQRTSMPPPIIDGVGCRMGGSTSSN